MSDPLRPKSAAKTWAPRDDYIADEIRRGSRHPDGRKRTDVEDVQLLIQDINDMKHFFNITQIVKHSKPIAGLVAKLRAGRKVEPLVELREHVDALHSLLMGWGRPQ